jgi:hypothetical protein
VTPSPKPPLKGENALTPEAALPGVDAMAHPGGAVVPQLVEGQEHDAYSRLRQWDRRHLGIFSLFF